MGLWQDLRFAVRLLVKDKWFTLVAAVALALGIGVNATVFTFVNAVLIRGLPIAEPDRILAVGSCDRVPQPQPWACPISIIKDWRETTKTFDALRRLQRQRSNLSDEGRRPSATAARTCRRTRFGCSAAAGASAATSCPTTIGPALRRWRSSATASGRTDTAATRRSSAGTVRINDVPTTIIGVMPEGFKFPQNADVWQPLAPDQRARRAEAQRAAAADVRPPRARACTREQAQSEMINIRQRLERRIPTPTRTSRRASRRSTSAERRADSRGVPVADGRGRVRAADRLRQRRQPAAGARRATARARSRCASSLGATRWRIVRQLLMESVLLVGDRAACSASALAIVGIRLFDARDAGRRQAVLDSVHDGRQRLRLLRARSASAPASCSASRRRCTSSKTDVNEVLKEGGRSGSAGMRARRWTGALMVAELALTLVLLAGAGFMMRNFLTMYRMDIGIDTSQLLTMSLALPDRKYPALEQRLAFYERLEERLQANPQIRERHHHQQHADAGRLPAQARHRGQAARPGPTGAERDDADDRSALLQDDGPAAAARDATSPTKTA